jgi:CheY-like chemotaxis protein
MARILIVEDEVRDFRFAERCARWCGFSEVDGTPSAEAAQALLEKAHSENRALPDAILLDLDLGRESGFNFLRFRYKNPEVLKVPVVVWTQLGDENRELCNVFKVQGYIGKSDGEYELGKALESLRLPSSQKDAAAGNGSPVKESLE